MSDNNTTRLVDFEARTETEKKSYGEEKITTISSSSGGGEMLQFEEEVVITKIS